MQYLGKAAKAWIKCRKQWFKDHPDEWFYCALRISPGCPGAMRREETTLDHIVSRSRAPELRYEMSNLQPACWPCNQQKGSRSMDEI